jgi:hypothetical protein
MMNMAQLEEQLTFLMTLSKLVQGRPKWLKDRACVNRILCKMTEFCLFVQLCSIQYVEIFVVMKSFKRF